LSSEWSQPRADYDVAHLTADTTALLVPATPVVARMETLRRAVIYASLDKAAAAQLLSRLTERARINDAYAWLDAAYLTEAMRQIGRLGQSAAFRDSAPWVAELVRIVDGLAMIDKALLLKPDDAGLEFAAALIHADKNRRPTRNTRGARKPARGATSSWRGISPWFSTEGCRPGRRGPGLHGRRHYVRF